jgi:hypothetical protein
MKSAWYGVAAFALVVAGLLAVDTPTAQADGYGGRQYYSGWSYHSDHGYHYRHYHYKPYQSYRGYRSHYCVYYPSQPRYVYYYNPYEKVYWGRMDLEGKEGAQYSLLKEEDRKGKVGDIPEAAFPKPGQMPQIPEAKDDVRIEAFSDLPADLPPGE